MRDRAIPRVRGSEASPGARGHGGPGGAGKQLRAMAFLIDPNALYSLRELEKGLRGIVELPTFIDRLGLKGRRVFRDALLGAEILRAFEVAQPYSQLLDRAATPVRTSGPAGGARRVRGGSPPLRKFKAEDLRGAPDG